MANPPLSSSPLPPVITAKTVWHYTTAGSLEGIVGSYEVWATSASSQVDKDEGLFAWRLVREVWENLDRADLNVGGCRLVDRVLQEDLGDYVQKNVYTLSASASPSVPYLWEEYARMDGFALGLNTEYFWAPKYRLEEILAPDTKFDRNLPAAEGWRQVIYDRCEQIACIEHALTWIANNWWRVGEVPGIYLPWAKFIDSARFILLSLLLLMKEESFKPETEVRFIAGKPPEALVGLSFGEKSYLPLATIPRLIYETTQSGLPVVNLVYGPKTDPNYVMDLVRRIGLPLDRVLEVQLEKI